MPRDLALVLRMPFIILAATRVFAERWVARFELTTRVWVVIGPPHIQHGAVVGPRERLLVHRGLGKLGTADEEQQAGAVTDGSSERQQFQRAALMRQARFPPIH